MSKIRESAKGEECQIRIPGICNHNKETTVLAHLGGAGMALKMPDYLAAYACSDCHAVVDGAPSKHPRIKILLWFYEAVFRTQKILEMKKLLAVVK